jgi:hypothetical protein
MELEKYIQSVGELMPISLNLLTELEASGSKYDFAIGSEEYPTSFKDLRKKLKELLWQKK